MDCPMALTHATAAKPTKRLDTLPHEILAKILRYALVSMKQPIHFVDADALRGCLVGEPVAPFHKLDVLAVNKTIYFAGVEAYFGSSTFNIQDIDELKRFVEVLGPDRRRHIRKLVLNLGPRYTLYVDKGKDESVKICFGSLPSLQKVVVGLRMFLGVLQVINNSSGDQGDHVEAEKGIIEYHVERYWAMEGVEIEYPWT